MKIRYPSYYEQFSCIADRCEDTCCAGWEIDIDDETYQYYSKIEGIFGEELRHRIKEYEREEDDAYESHGFVLTKQKRCPFLDNSNLCRIYRELGESALCDVCTDTPRNYIEYGGEREVAISAACPEAGRLIYGSREPMTIVEKETDEKLDFEESEEELVLARAIRRARDQAIAILQNRHISVEERICACLQYAEHVQKCLNEDSPDEIYEIEIERYYMNTTKVEYEEETAYRLFLLRMRSFTELESVNEEWERMLLLLQKRYVESDEGAKYYAMERMLYDRLLTDMEREYEKEHLIVYYCFLCLARCVDDYDFLGKMKFAVTAFLMVRDMDTAWCAEHDEVYTKEDRVRMARIYAKEIEHSERNMEYLMDEFLFEDAYTVENLCVSLTSVQN